MNGLELAQNAVALFRSVRGGESLYLQCQRFDGFYIQWAWQGGNGDDIQTYYNAQEAARTAAANGRIYTMDYNDSRIEAGEKVYYVWGNDWHVCSVVGRDAGGLIVSNTARSGDNLGDLGNHVKLSHAHTLGLELFGISSRDGNNPHISGVSMWSPGGGGGGSIAGDQRRVAGGGARGRVEPNSSSAKDDDAYLEPGDVGNFDRWTRGETVEGNNVWFRGAYRGRWYWSGSFEGGANTDGLTEIAQEKPAVSGTQRVVTGDGVYERTGPGTNYAQTGREFPSGDVLDLKAWTRGQQVTVNGVTSDVWYQGAYAEKWFAAACFTSQSTDGLPEVKVTETTNPNPPVKDPDWKTRTPDSTLAKWVGSPNFNYRTPRPAGAKPTHITDHWMDGTLAGTDAQFQKGDGEGSAATYGVGQREIHQYVREADYQQADGNADSNRWGISVEHEGGLSIPVTEAVYDLSAKLHADISKRYGWKSLREGGKMTFAQVQEFAVKNPEVGLVFPHKHWVSTQCPGNLDLAKIVSKTNALLNPGGNPAPENPSDDTISVDKNKLRPIWEWLKGIFGG